MGVISWLANKFRATTPVALQKRSIGYAAAEYSRINASLVSEARHINEIIRWQGYALLARSRQLADNDPYVVKFLQMVSNNVCGPQPFILQGRIKTKSNKTDTIANTTIESAWADWGKVGICDRYGRHSLNDLYRLIMRLVPRDGECFIRLHEGINAGPWGFQLQVIDTDRIDFNHNQQLTNGNVIHAGIEVDREGRTVAYHVRKTRPAQWQYGANFSTEYERVPADQMIHLFVPLSAEQVRGVPWVYAALIRLHQLNMFEEAAVIAARVGAAKMGFFEKTDPAASFLGEEEKGDDGKPTGAKVTDAEPGSFEELPAGLSFKEWNPNYPSDQVGPFIKSCMRGISSGLCVSYYTLGNDQEAVNFSSARVAILEEREFWMTLQNWFIEHLCEPVYGRFLSMATLTGKLTLNGALSKYMAINFQPRRWQWVQPLDEVNAKVMELKWGLNSRKKINAEKGDDFEDIAEDLASEADIAADKKIDITETPKSAGGSNNAQDNKKSE